jgi:hypothetical protein
MPVSLLRTKVRKWLHTRQYNVTCRVSCLWLETISYTTTSLIMSKYPKYWIHFMMLLFGFFHFNVMFRLFNARSLSSVEYLLVWLVTDFIRPNNRSRIEPAESADQTGLLCLKPFGFYLLLNWLVVLYFLWYWCLFSGRSARYVVHSICSTYSFYRRFHQFITLFAFLSSVLCFFRHIYSGFDYNAGLAKKFNG